MVGKKHMIIAVHVRNRLKEAGVVQKLLTEYGCYIRTRIGLHEVSGDFCSPEGLLLLEMFGDKGKCKELKDKLDAIEGLDVKQVLFSHD